MKKKIFRIALFTFLLLPVMNVSAASVVDCGNVTNIPAKIPQLTSLAVSIIQIIVPIILVVVGSIDLLKGVSAQKEDEIKKARQVLIKRLIVAFVIFFVIAIAKFLVSVVADSTEKENIVSCIDCFLSNGCKTSNAPSDGGGRGNSGGANNSPGVNNQSIQVN